MSNPEGSQYGSSPNQSNLVSGIHGELGLGYSHYIVSESSLVLELGSNVLFSVSSNGYHVYKTSPYDNIELKSCIELWNNELVHVEMSSDANTQKIIRLIDAIVKEEEAFVLAYSEYIMDKEGILCVSVEKLQSYVDVSKLNRWLLNDIVTLYGSTFDNWLRAVRRYKLLYFEN
ncbi:12253_t:CDS:1, partial [Ambispora gerdemannii]